VSVRPGRLVGRGIGVLLLALGVAQLALVVALVQPIDWGWQILGILGTTFGLGQFLALAIVFATCDARRKLLVEVVTLIAAMAVLAAAASWASLYGGALLFEADQAPRIWTIILADGGFAVWAIVLALDPSPPNAPGIPALAGLLAIRTVVEWFYFLPILLPTSPPVDQPAGNSGGGTILLFGAVMLGGYVVIGLWDLALGRWLISGDFGRPVTPSPTR
jgi:hypothetical protein